MTDPSQAPGAPCTDSSFVSRVANEIDLPASLADLADHRLRPEPAPALAGWLEELAPALQRSPTLRSWIESARQFRPAPGAPVRCTRLAEDTGYRLSLLAIHPDRSIPLHDHPGIHGAQRCLEGALLVRQFDLAAQQPPGPNLTLLRPAGQLRLTGRRTATLTPTLANIHAMQAERAPTVLLSVQILRAGAPLPSWYFPTGSSPTPSLLLCTRVQHRGGATSPTD